MSACLGDTELSALARGELTGETLSRASPHLAGCPSCQERLRKLSPGTFVAAPARDEASGPTIVRSPGFGGGGGSGPVRLPSGEAVDVSRMARMGRYVVLQRLGEGGMGVVYLAYDPELDRRVALKLLRNDFPGRLPGNAQARLLREAQAMARLTHPNVVAVHDVGTLGDEVFVAMDFVEGETLASWLLQRPHGWREVLAIFLEAGKGLAAAHAVGIVHRDFKPDNVLIGKDGVVRVGDFGLAAAIEPTERSPSAASTAPEGAVLPFEPAHDEPITEPGRSVTPFATPLTLAGSVMGTPGYMSPEQHLGAAADARSDEFSFCVALYEALFRQRPFLGDTQEMLALAVARGAVREVLRGLHADREKRFPDMVSLLAALRNDVAKRRARLAAMAGAMVLVGLGLWGASAYGERRRGLCLGGEQKLAAVWDAAVSARARTAFSGTGLPYADDAFGRSSAALDRYGRELVEREAGACVATRIHREASEEALDLRVSCLDGRLRALAALGRLFAAADRDVVENSVRASASLPSLADCDDLAALRGGPRRPADPAHRAEVDRLEERLREARALSIAGKVKDARSRLASLVPAIRLSAFAPLLATALEIEGSNLHDAGDAQGALPVFEEALATAEGASMDRVKLEALSGLAAASTDLARWDASASWLRFARATLARLGNPEEGVAGVTVLEARLAWKRGKLEEAAAGFARALAIREKLGLSSGLAELHNDLGNVFADQGKLGDSRREYEGALAAWRAELGEEHPSVARGYANLATSYLDEARFGDALPAFEKALRIREKSLGPDHPAIARTLSGIGGCYSLMRKPLLAIPYQERALSIFEKAYGKEHPEVALALVNLGSGLAEAKRAGEALPVCRRAVAINEKLLGKDHPDLAYSLTCEGNALLGMNRPGEAIATLERALELRTKHEGGEYQRALSEFTLAQALVESGRARARGLDLARKAQARFTASGADKATLDEIGGWLREHGG
jgi:tetratricopeptide (TPR) repeat protein